MENGNLKVKTFGIFISAFIVILIFIFGLAFNAIGNVYQETNDVEKDISDIKSTVSGIDEKVDLLIEGKIR